MSTPESYLETPQSEHVTALDTFARRAPRISQADVFQAADALLVEGHRPTIDRVRMRLGRGSPNTINDHLDAWWSKLGARLRDLPGKEFPQLPERVAHSLQQLWNEALQAGLLEREHSLDQRASALQQASRQLAEREQAATARAIGLEESLALVRDQLAAANQRAQALEKNLEERDRECARLRRRVETLEVSATEARAKFDAAAAAHQAERAQLQGRHEAAEGHWQREVDRARQLAKEAAKDHERQCTDFRDQIGTLQTDRGQLRQELREVRSDLKTALIVREQLEARRLAIRSPPKRMSRAADRPAKRPRTPKGGSKIKVRERARGQGALRQPMIKCEILEPVRASCLSLSFVGDDESLVHGNEILAGQIVGYERQKRLRQSDHTFDNIVAAVQKLVDNAPWYPEVLRDLAHYLVFDALICNTDRHHENWGFLTRFEEVEPEKWMMQLQLAPSFDHASSLGRELRDNRRQTLLLGSGMDHYVRRGRGGIYWRKTDAHGANPVQLVEVLARQFPDYFRPALDSVAKAPIADLCAVVEEVPESRMSPTGKEFAKALLAHTHGILAGLKP